MVSDSLTEVLEVLRHQYQQLTLPSVTLMVSFIRLLDLACDWSVRYDKSVPWLVHSRGQ